MSSNPFHDVLEDRYRCGRVVVKKGKRKYWGWLRIWHYNQPAVVLDDAVLIGESSAEDEIKGTVYINDPDIVENEHSNLEIDLLPPSTAHPSPYNQREFNDTDFYTYVRELRERGHLSSFPTLRPIDDGDDGYEIINGHRRVRAADEAGLQSVPVNMVRISDWEAATRFVYEHIPLTVDEVGYGESSAQTSWYSKDEIEAAVDALIDRWGEDRVRELPPTRRWLNGELTPEDGENAESSK